MLKKLSDVGNFLKFVKIQCMLNIGKKKKLYTWQISILTNFFFLAN